MSRLNSGIFRIFEFSEWSLKLNSSDCRASKIIGNDTKVELISWEPNKENLFLNFCVGVCIGEHPPSSFDTDAITGGDRGNMVLHKKLTKKQKLRRLKLRGLMWNQISTPNFAYQNDQRNKLYTLGDFENKIPTYMAVTHAISKSEQNFQNRIPRELDKNFYILRFSVIHWITFNIPM